jgi:hypothetical protein
MNDIEEIRKFNENVERLSSLFNKEKKPKKASRKEEIQQLAQEIADKSIIKHCLKGR